MKHKHFVHSFGPSTGSAVLIWFLKVHLPNVNSVIVYTSLQTWMVFFLFSIQLQLLLEPSCFKKDIKFILFLFFFYFGSLTVPDIFIFMIWKTGHDSDLNFLCPP